MFSSDLIAVDFLYSVARYHSSVFFYCHQSKRTLQLYSKQKYDVTYDVICLLAVRFLGVLELSACSLILFLVFAHFFEKLLKDLPLADIERLVLVWVGAKTSTFLPLLSFSFSFLGRHFEL